MTGEVFRALGVLAEAPTEESVRLSKILGLPSVPTSDDHTELFLFQVYPYASVYLGAEGMLGGDARDRIAGFWRAIGAVPPAEPDHLVTLLAAYADLGDRRARASTSRQRRALDRTKGAFLWEHLVPWVPCFLEKVAQLDIGPYGHWSRLLTAALRQELEEVPLPRTIPLHLRMTAPLDPAVAEREEVLGAVLSPIRSGMILTRADLARAARETGLGLRAGERRFALEGLLAQDARSVLAWLEQEAHRWIVRHRARQAWLPDVAGDWLVRAERAAAALARLTAGQRQFCEYM